MRLPMIATLIFAMIVCFVETSGQIVTLSKTHTAPTPVPSGQVFTYTLAWSYTGPAGATIQIRDILPASLEAVSALPMWTSVAGSTYTWTFTVASSSEAGTIQLNVRYPIGTTCDNVSACNKADIRVGTTGPWIPATYPGVICAVSDAVLPWTLEAQHFFGCAVGTDPDDGVTYVVRIKNPTMSPIGVMNMLNARLDALLPAGATASIVAASGTSWTSTGPNQWQPAGGTILASSWLYVVYVKVTYPTPTFAAGQDVCPIFRLSFNYPCQPLTEKFRRIADTVCTTLCGLNPPSVPSIGFGLDKSLQYSISYPASPVYLPTLVPGCCATWRVRPYVNATGAPMSGVVVQDGLPGSIAATSVFVHVPPGSGPATLKVYPWIGPPGSATCGAVPSATVAFPVSGTYTVPAGLNVCQLRWEYAGTIAPGTIVNNRFDFCIRSVDMASGGPVVAGQNILNCAYGTGSFSGTTYGADDCDSFEVGVVEPKIVATKHFVGNCSGGTASPGGPWSPGSIVRWRLAVANIGSADAVMCTISDNLPPGLNYVGNVTYGYGSFGGPVSAFVPSCGLLSTTPPPAIGAVSGPTAIGSTITFSCATLPYRCDGEMNWLIIEFDVQVSTAPPAAPGAYNNTFTFDASNVLGPIGSTIATMTVNAIARVKTTKDVRWKKPGTVFSTSASIPAGQFAEYQLRMENTGNLPLTDLRLLDVLPHIGDIASIHNVPVYPLRGSTIDMPIDPSGGVITPAGFSVIAFPIGASSNTKNPRRTTIGGGFCASVNPTNGVPPVGPPSPPLTTAIGTGSPTDVTQSFLVAGLPGHVLNPGDVRTVIATVRVPYGAVNGALACNNFGFRGNITGVSSTTCLALLSPTACVTVDNSLSVDCGDVWIDGGQDSCCTYDIGVSDVYGAVVGLSYTVLDDPTTLLPSGSVNSIASVPCPPVTATYGSTSGGMTFDPSCTASQVMDFNIDATASSPSGVVCIALTVSILPPGSTVPVKCSDTICIVCDPIPTVACDRIDVLPVVVNGAVGKRMIITNLKVPASPICSVNLTYSPPPSAMTGGALFADGTSRPWTMASSAGWTTISSGALTPPANATVDFQLAVFLPPAYAGVVNIDVIHCDGDTCRLSVPWGPRMAIAEGGTDSMPVATNVVQVSIPDALDRVASIADKVRSCVVVSKQPILGVTGPSIPCVECASDSANLVRSAEHSGNVAVFRFIELDARDRRRNGDDDVALFCMRAPDSDYEVVLVYCGVNAQEIGRDTLRPGTTTGVRGRIDQDPNALSRLMVRPNPVTGTATITCEVSEGGFGVIEIRDVEGREVRRIQRNLSAGGNDVEIGMDDIASGTYVAIVHAHGRSQHVIFTIQR